MDDFGRAVSHHRENRFSEAATFYRRSLAGDPQSTESLRLYAALATQTGDAHQAKALAQRALTRDRSDAALYWMLASAQSTLGDTKGATTSGRRALALFPSMVDAWSSLANASLVESRRSYEAERNAVFLADALRSYDRLFALDPTKVGLGDLAGLHIEYGNRRRAYYYHALWHAGRLPSAEANRARGFQVVPSGIIQAIGHMVWLDGYLKAMELGLRERHDLIVLAPSNRIANAHYLDYWRDYVTVVTDAEYLQHLDFFRRYSEYGPGSMFSEGRSQGLTDAVATVQRMWEEQGRSPLLAVRDSDRGRGWSALGKLGMPRDAWFVGVHMREPGFDRSQEAIHRGHERNFAEQEHRNVSIEKFLPAMKRIVSRGGWVVRLGDPSMTPLPPMPNVIDYALSDQKSDWMDVFLLGTCRFFLGTSSGLWCVPMTFGIPAAVTNVAPLATRPLSTRDLFMPKLAWSEREKRFLSFEESMREPIGFASHAGVLKRYEVTPIENSAEEIEELAVEMMDRLDGRVAYSREDEKLQARHLEISKVGSNWGVNSRIGRDFLRRHASLLGPGIV